MNTVIAKIQRFTVLTAAAVFALANISCDSGSGGDGGYSPWFERSGRVGELTISQKPPASTSAGSFVVKGYAKNDYLNYLWIRVSKSGEPNNYDYFVRGASNGAFEQEIWLRYGQGDYTVTFYNLSEIKVNLNGEGAFYSCTGYYSSATTFPVTNAWTGASPDDWTLLPSGDIQITTEIQDLSNTICAGKFTPAGKIEAINAWIIQNLHYDHDSWAADGSRDGYRKKQDALSALRNRMGVCEGYANLTAALARAAGIKTRYVISEEMDHAWVEVYIGKWKMLDTTWNDPDNAALNGDTTITQKYFLKDDLYYEHSNDKEVIKTRSVSDIGKPEDIPRSGAYVRRGQGE
jgi:hypothetical protein